MGVCVVTLACVACLAVKFITAGEAFSAGELAEAIPLPNYRTAEEKYFADEAAESTVQFLLFTKFNPVFPTFLMAGDVRTLGNFDPSFPTAMVIHGFHSNQRNMMPIAEAYLGLDAKMNVIVVNWTVLATTDILSAIDHVDIVASAASKLITFLVARGLNTADLTIVGFSLGAHVAGIAAYQVDSVSVGRIVGLDPAGPFFNVKSNMKKLSRSDADFVQVAHTTINTIGYNGDLGHVDFYFNGGTEPQPGCASFTDCSHLRATEYFAESIKGTIPFVATQCSDNRKYISGKCQLNRRTIFSPNTPVSVRGKYFLTTNEFPPYAQG